MAVRLNEFDVYFEIREMYTELRKKASVIEAEEEIRRTCMDYFTDEDDGPIAKIALAKAQIQRRELTEAVAIQSEEAAAYVRGHNEYYQICKREMDALLSNLKDPDRRIGQDDATVKPKARRYRRPFQTEWKVGDVYAFRMKGSEAESMELDGRYCLLRVVDKVSDFPKEGGRTIPICYFSIWRQDVLPRCADDIRSVGLLQLMSRSVYCVQNPDLYKALKNAGASIEEMCRTGAVKVDHSYDATSYRSMIDITSRKVLSDFAFEYVGHFPELGVAEDDAARDNPKIFYACYACGYYTLKNLDDSICFSYKHFGTMHPQMIPMGT